MSTTKKFLTIILVGLVLWVLSIITLHPGTAGAQSYENNQTNQSYLALNKKGLELLNSGMYNESLGYFDKALAVSPDNARILDNKGFALYSLGNLSGALHYYDKALAIEPNYTTASNDKELALLKVGNQLLKSGSYSDAIGYYDRVSSDKC